MRFGGGLISAPFALFYKFFAIDNIDSARFHVTLEPDPDVKDFVIPWYGIRGDVFFEGLGF